MQQHSCGCMLLLTNPLEVWPDRLYNFTMLQYSKVIRHGRPWTLLHTSNVLKTLAGMHQHAVLSTHPFGRHQRSNELNHNQCRLLLHGESELHGGGIQNQRPRKPHAALRYDAAYIALCFGLFTVDHLPLDVWCTNHCSCYCRLGLFHCVI